MTAVVATRARLLATVPVTSLVGTRVWSPVLPQSPTLPAIQLQLIDEVPTKHLRGPDAMRPARVQADVWVAEAGDYEGNAHAVMQAVEDALIYEGFAISGVVVKEVTPTGREAVRNELGAPKFQFGLRQDFIVRYRLA